MRMGRVLLPWVLSVGLGGVVGAQEQPPGPGQSTQAEIVSQFEAALPTLLADWIRAGYDADQEARLGQYRTGPGCGPFSQMVFQFMECTDIVPPSITGFDVRKTESILTPYLGVISVNMKQRCTLRLLVPKGMNWPKAAKTLEPYCLGKTYDECLNAGAKPPGSVVGANCTGGRPERSFNFSDTPVIHYRWSHGKWEFASHEKKPPSEPEP